MIHEILGLHEAIRDVARRLAREGYEVVAPELFAREGGMATLRDIPAVVGVVQRIADRQVLGDLSATIEYARGRSWVWPDRVGAMGFRWGGRMTWLLAAHERRLAAAVAWYGPLGPWRGCRDDARPQAALDVAYQIHGPVLGLRGEPTRGLRSRTSVRWRPG